MTEPEQHETETFSLSTGGALFALSRRTGLAHRTVIRALILTALAWIPLLIISLVNGTAVGGVRIPFLYDYGAYGRLLVALPILVIAETPIGRRTRQVLHQFATRELVREQDAPRVSSAIHHAARQKDSFAAELIILVIIYAASVIRIKTVQSAPAGTWYYSGGQISTAGWYYAFVSVPIFQFLLARWIWRLLIWSTLLWRISKIDLQLVAIHPDRMGGLGFLGLAQIPFSIIGFAGGAVLSSYLINNMVYQRLSLPNAVSIIATYVILAVPIIIAPILVFTGKLIGLRASGILKYGHLGEDYTTSFQRKWIEGVNPENEPVLGTSDIQSLADLANSFAIVQNMRITPVDRNTLVVIVAMLLLPMVPVLFVALPFEEIIMRLIGIRG